MTNVLSYNNVFFDNASIYPSIDVLNEKSFLKNLFIELNKSLKNFEDFYFFIFCGSKETNPSSITYNEDQRKKVLIYLSDESGYVPKQLTNYYDYIFKIHLKKAYPELNIYPFPLGYAEGVENLPYIPPLDRQYNCFYSGNLNPGREKFWIHFTNHIVQFFFRLKCGKFRILNKYTKPYILKFDHFRKFDNKYPKSIIRFTHKFGSGFNKFEYSRLLQQSKIVLCPKGFISSECYRHYEALRAGCILISEPLPETYFYKNSPIIQLTNWEHLDEIINNLLNSPEMLTKLSIESKNWYELRMSEKAVATYLNNIISQNHSS